MSVKKYRMYLLMVMLVAVIVGALSYLYFAEQEKVYQEGTLVWNECVMEEEAV